ncbi:MAG: hypothetical protein IPM46_04805 [Flavobacteriales bacterium]|nr:hypothetical protein [Flavobacteriales bacterium]
MLFNFSQACKRLSIALAISTFAGSVALAQLPTNVEIDLAPGVGTNQLDVRLKANGASFSEVISGLTFTIRWPGTSPAGLGVFNSAWCPSPSLALNVGGSAQVTDGSFHYRTYTSTGTAQIGETQNNSGCGDFGQVLPAGTWITIGTIGISTNTTCTQFQIVNDAFTGANNRNFFVSLNGVQGLAGPIEGNPVCTSNTACGVTIGSIGSNGPICVGSTLNLTASATGTALTYSWIGPNGFTSNLQNPSIVGATSLASGTYTVTVASNGCQSRSRTIDVAVTTPNNPGTLSGDQTICVGGGTTFFSTVTGGS